MHLIQSAKSKDAAIGVIKTSIKMNHRPQTAHLEGIPQSPDQVGIQRALSDVHMAFLAHRTEREMVQIY